MKILISTLGSRGDVQPYLALAVGLKQAGHHATLATSYNFTEWIQSHGVSAHPTSFSVQEFMQKPETQALIKGLNPIRELIPHQNFNLAHKGLLLVFFMYLGLQ